MVQFKCKLCNATVSFDPSDTNTFITKSESGNPLIGKLFTFRVGHETAEGRLHINVIVLDERLEYRAHKDFYEESMDEQYDNWDANTRIFPLEIQPYLVLASPEDKNQINSYLASASDEVINWEKMLVALQEENQKSPFFQFLVVKWFFLTGKEKKLTKKKIKPGDWAYPLYLRNLSRTTTEPSLLKKAQALATKDYPILLDLEAAIAQAEIYYNLNNFDLLEEIYLSTRRKWVLDSSLEIKTALFFIQSFYALGVYRRGNIKEAIALIKPAFDFAQLIEHREMLIFVSNQIALMLKENGEIELAMQAFELALFFSEELGDIRSNILVAANIALMDFEQGHYQKALTRLQQYLNHAVVQSSPSIQLILHSHIADCLFALEAYKEAKKLSKQALEVKIIPIALQAKFLTVLKDIARKTTDKELAEWVRKNVPKSDYFESARGLIFLKDLEAISEELAGNWEKVVQNLNEELEIILSYELFELASSVEIRIAEANYRLYQETNSMAFLNEAYKHLDLAKTIALQSHYYDDLCKLSVIKGLLASQTNLTDRAEQHFKEALQLAQEYRLSSLESQIIERIVDLQTGVLEGKSGQAVESMFKGLDLKRTDERLGKSKSKLLSLLVYRKDSHRPIIFLDKSTVQEYYYYLFAIHDQMKVLLPIFEKNKISSSKGSIGTVLIEQGKDVYILALVESESYATKVQIQKVLEELESFPLKHISEEFSGKTIELLLASFSNIKYYDIISKLQRF